MSIPEMYRIACADKKLFKYISKWFDPSGRLRDDVNKEEIEFKIFNSFGYDEKLTRCVRLSSWKILIPIHGMK